MATYVKIHKINHDGSNNDIALGQATKLRIKHTTLPEYVTIGDIINRTEYPTYWLYQVNSLGSNTADNFVKDYNVSASLSTTLTINNGNSSYPILNNTSYNPNNFFNTTTGRYSIPQTPNVAINFTLSGTASAVTNNAELNLRIYNTGSEFLEQISSGNIGNGIYYPIVVGTPLKFDFTGSITSYAFPGNNIIPFISNNDDGYSGNLSITNLKLNFSQSIPPTSSVSCSVIIEPYLTEPNYYNSDNNPLLNSVSDQRESTYALDVDYGYGTTPINFDLLVSGSATAATVPDSNYTIKKSIIPRYEGSKTTSQYLNKYTSGDQGTYGKLPTVEILRNAFIIAGWIGGWSPEIEGASAANINYIVREDGTLIKPFTTQNALQDLRHYFTDGENVTISSLENTGSINKNYYKILKSGYQPQNILRTQKEGNPNPGLFSSSLRLEDINIGLGSGSGANIVEDYQGSLSSWVGWAGWDTANNIFGTSNGNNTINDNQFYEVALPTINSKGLQTQYSSSILARRYPGTNDVSSSRYKVTQAIIDDKVTLYFRYGFWVEYWPRNTEFWQFENGADSVPWNPTSIKLTHQVVKLRDGVEEILFTSQPSPNIITEEENNAILSLQNNASIQIKKWGNTNYYKKYYAKQQRKIYKGPDSPGLSIPSFSIPYTILKANDQIFLKVKVDAAGLNQPKTYTGDLMQKILLTGYFDTWQSPAPSGTANASGFWISASSLSTQNITKQMINSSSYNPYLINGNSIPSINTDYITSGSSVLPLFDGDNILFTTSSLFVNNFGNKYAKAVDIIPLNGFDPITLPWEIKRGDEFKFEGNEDQVYMVRKAAPLSCSGGFILAVELDKPLPKSGSLNYSNFSIKRYGDFEGNLIFKGEKPSLEGPFIITPEFITPKLSNNISDILKDMTAKGLL